MNQQSLLLALLIASTATSAKCGLLEMSQTLWTKAVSGGLTKIGKLDPLRVPFIKVDQSEGNTSYRMILRNLEIVGLNESTLESVHVARGGLRSNLSEIEAGYVSYSDLSDVESIRYRFHTMMREPYVSKRGFEAVVSPSDQAAKSGVPSNHREDHFARLQQDRYRSGTFEQGRQYDRQYDRQTFSRPDAIHDGPHRGDPRTQSYSATNPGNVATFQRPAYVRPVSSPRAGVLRDYRTGSPAGEDAVDCEDAYSSQYRGNHRDNRRYEPRRQGAYGGGRYEERTGVAEVSASEAVGIGPRDRGDARTTVSYDREQSRTRPDVTDDPRAPKEETSRQSGYIDIVYAADRADGSVKRFGNFGVDPKEDRRVYGIEDVMKEIRENARFVIHNFTEGEALTKRNDMVKAAIEAKEMKDSMRYANGHQERQGYFEEGMQLIYHYGGTGVINDESASRDTNGTTRRAKRGHSEEAAEDNVMHVILRIRVPLLQVRSQYTLVGKVGKEMLRGNGLLVGNFTDLVGDFTLELKKIDNGKLMIVRAARAKLSAGDKKIALQGMDEEGPVRAVFDYGFTAAEAVAAMLADDFATKGLTEKTADAVVYRMYQDLPVN